MSPLRDLLAAWQFGTLGVLTALCVTIALMFTVLPAALVIRDKTARIRYLTEVAAAAFLAAVMGLLGWVTGYLTGASRESVVGDLIPAVLGAVGAFGGFVGLKYGRAVSAGLMIAAFAFCLFIGSAIGGKIREAHDALDLRLPPLEVLEQEARKEAMIKKYRQDLGLPWPPELDGDKDKPGKGKGKE